MLALSNLVFTSAKESIISLLTRLCIQEIHEKLGIFINFVSKGSFNVLDYNVHLYSHH